VIRQFATMGIGPANEATKMSSYGQVESFDMAGTYKSRLRASASDACYRTCNPIRGAHPIRPRDVRTRIELDELREVDTDIEMRVNGINVGAKAIARKLEHAFRPCPKIAHNLPRAISVSVADVVRDDKFRFAVQSNPRPRTAPFLRSIATQSLFVASNERMQLIGLHQVGLNPANQTIKQPLALRSRRHHEIKNRSDVKARQSRDRTHAHAFHHQFQNAGSRVQIGVVGLKPFDGLRESGIAGLAAPTLDAALTKVTELFAGLMLAFEAGHDPALDFLAGRADDCFASALRLTPRAEQPRFSVRAESGASGCWGDCSVLSEFPRSRGACSKSHELQSPNRGGIQGFAPKNALVLDSSPCRSSDCHGNSPFAWIEHLKSFRFLLSRQFSFRLD
jgi:hypothetical protein